MSPLRAIKRAFRTAKAVVKRKGKPKPPPPADSAGSIPRQNDDSQSIGFSPETIASLITCEEGNLEDAPSDIRAIPEAIPVKPGTVPRSAKDNHAETNRRQLSKFKSFFSSLRRCKIISFLRAKFVFSRDLPPASPGVTIYGLENLFVEEELSNEDTLEERIMRWMDMFTETENLLRTKEELWKEVFPSEESESASDEDDYLTLVTVSTKNETPIVAANNGTDSNVHGIGLFNDEGLPSPVSNTYGPHNDEIDAWMLHHVDRRLRMEERIRYSRRNLKQRIRDTWAEAHLRLGSKFSRRTLREREST